MGKKILKKFGLNLSDLRNSNNGDSEEVDGVILFKTPVREMLEKLEEHQEETREERKK